MLNTRVILAAIAVSIAPAMAAAQSMFRGGPEHLGIYESPTAPSLASVAWKFKTQGRVVSSPVLVGDAVYVGSTDGNLYALNRADGTLRWKFATRGAVNSRGSALVATVPRQAT